MNRFMVSCRYLEVWHSRFVGKCNSKCDDLLICRLKFLLVGGYLVNVGSRQTDSYLAVPNDV